MNIPGHGRISRVFRPAVHGWNDVRIWVRVRIEEGFETLDSYAHPDPYIVPTMYGGSKYARNPPVPGNIHVIRDFGREKESVPREA